LRELEDYHKIHGHCSVPKNYSENTRLATWVATQRKQYNLHLKEKISSMTLPRIQELENMGFEWDRRPAPWEDRLSELAEYRKRYGNCNVPKKYSENKKLGNWVGTQRKQHRLHLNGKRSQMTLPRIQALESLGFEWNGRSTSRGKGF
jgi:hypothetical protein